MTYKTQGVCAKEIHFNNENGVVTDVEFVGGCNGNGKALSAMVQGQKVDEVVSRLKGITCGLKRTSCADQLAKALENK